MLPRGRCSRKRGLKSTRRPNAVDWVYKLRDRAVETGASAAGPWDHAMQHGSAPAALIARIAEGEPTDRPMRLARITLDLMRPVPIDALHYRVDKIRRGRKIELLQISLFAGSSEVVRASALKIRVEASVTVRPSAVEPYSEEEGEPFSPEGPLACAFLQGISLRRSRSQASIVWCRIERDIVAGEAAWPTMRAAVAADFCNGISCPLDPRLWSFVNADLCLTMARSPLGSWIRVQANTVLGPDGAGTAFACLADSHGVFGTAVQSLVIERRLA
jgi:Thioesterase-like superfamily